MEEAGKRNCMASGASQPSNEGPRKIPAAISPITAGCPIRLKRLPSSLAAVITTAICSNSIVSGCCMRSVKLKPAADSFFTTAGNADDISVFPFTSSQNIAANSGTIVKMYTVSDFFFKIVRKS
jgi:hypothetical protein